MTDKNKKYNLEIENALLKRDFNLLLKLFNQNGFNHLQYIVFLKRNWKKVNTFEFWISQLPHFKLEYILESDLKVTFFEAYFSKVENSNTELNKHLLVIAKDDFIKHFKLWGAFFSPTFLDSFIQISAGNPELEPIEKEFSIIIKVQKRIEVESEQDKQFFLQFSLDEVFMAFTLYYHNFKQKPECNANKAWQTKIEMTLVNELNWVLSIFKTSGRNGIQIKNNADLQKEFKRFEAPHHNLGKEGLVIPLEAKYSFLFGLIDNLISRNGERGLIQQYISGFSDFKSTFPNPSHLRTNNRFRLFQINNSKSVPEELYFLDLELESIGKMLPSKTDISPIIKSLNFYGILGVTKAQEGFVDIEKVLKLLKYFATYKGPSERSFMPNGVELLLNKGDDKFIKLFGSNESITIFDIEQLENGISEYFNWSNHETELTLAYLTLNLQDDKLTSSWIGKPFIKINNNVLFLGAFLKDRRWDNVLINRLKLEPEYANLGNKLSKELELKIEASFKNSKFNTISGLRFKSSNGQQGDFDVLAYKDKHLFVCEVKSGLRSDDFFYGAYLETIRLEGCAAEQLEKSIFNLKEDWPNIKLKLGIEEKLDSITIVPLIITDYFEGDLAQYKNTYRKISFLELHVILNNNKKKLLQVYEFTRMATNLFNPNLNQNRVKIENWDLWEGQSQLSLDILLKNITNNNIWMEIEGIWKFEDEDYLVHY